MQMLMHEQEQLEQEQIENSNLSKSNIPSDDNNVDWLTENMDFIEDIVSKSDEFDEEVYLRVALIEWASWCFKKKNKQFIESFT